MKAILRNLVVLVITLCTFGVAWRNRRRLARSGASPEDWNRLFRSAFETAPQAAAFSDHFACFQYVNSALLKLWGYAYPSQVCGRWLFEFLAQPEKSAEILKVLRENGSWRGQTEGRRRDSSTFPVELTARTVSSGNGKAHWVLWCFSELAAHEADAIEGSGRTEAVTLAGAALAHDLNNLLTVITGCSSLALSRPDESPESRRLWAEVLDTVQSAAEITRQFLEFHRDPAQQSKPVALNVVITNLERLLARLAGPRIALNVSLAAEIGRVRLHPADLLQVIMNLVLNARDAMPNGGTIHIQTSREWAEPKLDRPFVVLTVSDTGAGMDETTRARAFEAFFSSKGSAGAGLGLAIVSSIVHKSGGYVRLETQPGAGTSLHVYFPEAESGGIGP